MKALFIVLIAGVLLTAVVSLTAGGRTPAAVAVGGASQTIASEQPATDGIAVAQPLDLSQLTPTYPNYPGVTPAPYGETNTIAFAEPIDPLKLTPTYPNYPGVTPAPAKNGPFGLVKAVPLDQLDSASAPSVKWFDTQEQLDAALKSLAPGSIIVGVLYENAPPSGRSLTIDSASCSITSGVPNLGGSYNFDNITSSLDNSCGTATLYFNPNYGGPQQSYPNGLTSNVGPGMNDQASSVMFAP